MISTRSMSSMVRPAFAKALTEAGPGPVSMIVGSVAVSATDSTRPRGVRPNSLPTFSLPTITSDAPSTMPEELPGVWTWLIRSTSGYFASAMAS